MYKNAIDILFKKKGFFLIAQQNDQIYKKILKLSEHKI